MDDEKNKQPGDLPENDISKASDGNEFSDHSNFLEKHEELPPHEPKTINFPFNIPSLYLKIAGALFAILALGMALFTIFSSPSELPKKIYNIAIDKTWYPLQLGIKDRNMTAFAETVLQTIAHNEKLNFRIQAATSKSLFQGVESGRYEGMLSLLTPEQSYAFHFLFSTPLYYLGPVIVINADAHYTSLDDLRGRNVGFMSNIKFQIDFDAYPKAHFIPYNNASQAFANLESKKVDAIIMNTLSAHTYLQSLYVNKFKIATPPLTNEGIRLVLQDDGLQSKLFMKHFNRGLQKMRDSGAYDELLRKWDLVNTEWKGKQ